MSSYLKVNQLILVGVRKNYVVAFDWGVNIIYGDSDTGKSSILEFINYLLGASNIELADEITAAVEYAALEIKINGIDYTIKRDIYDNKAYIEVYQCHFNDCAMHYPTKYLPNFNEKKDLDKFFQISY